MAGHICPNCHGRGLIDSDQKHIECDNCKGHGVIWDIPNYASKQSYNPDGILGKVHL